MSDPYGGGLPQAPPPPPQGAQDWGPPRGERPPSVVNAVRLMLVRAGIGLISIIALFATKDSLRSALAKKTPNVSSSTVDTAITVGAVVGIVFLVLYVLLAVQVGKGKNWARIVTFVLAGLGILSALSSLAQTEPVLSRILSIVTGLIDVGVVVLLAQGTSSRYFSPRR